MKTPALLLAGLTAAIVPAVHGDAEGLGAGERPGRRGFVRVGPSHHYFQYEGGAPFFAIGHNATAAFTAPVRENVFSLEDADRYFKNMHDHGENVLRFLHDWPAFPIEKPAGTFNPQFKEYLDRIVKLAEKHDIYLLLAMWPNVFPLPSGWPCSWQDHCYATRNGGPVARFNDFFRDEKALKLQEGRIRFFVDNWGRSRQIFAWELANEFDYDNDPWVGRMAKYCQQYEQAKYGKRHLVCISVGNYTFGGKSSQQWCCPHLDFAAFHTYDLKEWLKLWSDRGVERNVKLTFMIPEFCSRVAAKSPDRPLLDNEVPGLVHGPVTRMLNSTVSDAVMEESFLAAGWAYMCSGAAGTGLRWVSLPLYQVHGKPNALSEKLYQYQLAMRRFADRVDWNRIDPKPYSEIHAQTPKKEPLRTIAIIAKDRRRVVGWIFHTFGATERTRAAVSFSGLREEAHLLCWVDDATGTRLSQQHAHGATFTAKPPPFLGHVGFLLEPETRDAREALLNDRQGLKP